MGLFDGSSQVELKAVLANCGTDTAQAYLALKRWIEPKQKKGRSNDHIVAKLLDLERVFLPFPEMHVAFHKAREITRLPKSTVLPPPLRTREAERAEMLRTTVRLLWPERKVDTEHRLFACVGQGGYLVWKVGVRGKWRGFIDGSVSIQDPSLANIWTPLLVVLDLYSELLLTMADDEFFPPPGESRSQYNPYSLDEIRELSGLLLRISFALYWSADIVEQGTLSSIDLSWKEVRDRTTNVVVAIRARDTRRPFTKPEHWHVLPPAQDMPSFIHAMAMHVSGPGSGPAPGMQSVWLNRSIGVMEHIPFAVPFEVRARIFRQIVREDSNVLAAVAQTDSRRTFEIRRDHVTEDGYNNLYGLPPAALKGRLRIDFMDSFGNIEAGIDSGGLFKEFLNALTKDMFNATRGLWFANDRQELYPYPHAYARENTNLKWFRFMGRILGKALYEGILVDVVFAPFFLGKWLGKRGTLDDLLSMDPQLYRQLVDLKQSEFPEEFGVYFEATDPEFGDPDSGSVRTVPLCQGGSGLLVARENRQRYIDLLTSFRLDGQIRPQCTAFVEGLSDLIDPRWLKMFDERELQILVGGVEDSLDLKDWMDNTAYAGAYGAGHKTIKAFWEVVETFDRDQRRDLLRFATSCSRPPLLGFRELRPKFTIQDSTDEQSRLPTASTCFNKLKLPRYKDKETLRQKLLLAISSNAGFDLS